MEPKKQILRFTHNNIRVPSSRTYQNQMELVQWSEIIDKVMDESIKLGGAQCMDVIQEGIRND